MNFYVGTSGYSYQEWKGLFYPQKLPAKQMLRFYGEHFRTVEINYTFKRLPTASVVAAWADAVPADFQFALKAPEQITHRKRLNDVGVALCIADETDHLIVPFVATADWGCLRLRRPDYDDAALKTWVKRVRAQDWRDAFVFFKHEDEAKGPRLAKRFLELAK
jgi:uncharacterized protein YecE (DUF72 family)